MASRQPLILTLGSPNHPDGTLCTVALERCERALAEYVANPGSKILPTGGYGDHFNIASEPHGVYLQRHLINIGVPASRIHNYVHSETTIEDARLAKPAIEKLQPSSLVVVTSDYHAERAEYVFSRVLSDWAITFSICKTNTARCDVDLEDIMNHERDALAMLRLRGLPPEAL